MSNQRKPTTYRNDPQRAALKKARRIVVKVGTNLLTGGGTSVRRSYLNRLSAIVSQQWDKGREIAIVTSGAIGAGCGAMGFERPPRSVPDRQACAAAGQVELMKLYAQAFRRQPSPRAIGQLLLTRDGLEDRKRYLNARHTLEALFSRGLVPVVNENDTVAVDEIRFGDNDSLSALVAILCEAELLIMLTDVPGLLDVPPGEGKKGKLISTVSEISPEIEAIAKPTGSFLGTGGMTSKIEAARIVTSAGENMVLANGRRPEILEEILSGKAVGTFFPPHGDRLTARKRWIAFSTRPQGTIHVDRGAKEALVRHKKSLLPSGIVEVTGRFESGGLVGVSGPDGHVFARGLSNYSKDEVRQIRGLKTSKISKVLGQLLFEEVVHRDNLVLVKESKTTRISGRHKKPSRKG